MTATTDGVNTRELLDAVNEAIAEAPRLGFLLDGAATRTHFELWGPFLRDNPAYENSAPRGKR